MYDSADALKALLERPYFVTASDGQPLLRAGGPV